MKMTRSKKEIVRINQANTIYQAFLKHGRVIAQQAANAYYMNGRPGVREFAKRLHGQEQPTPQMPELSSITTT
jgi:hypothetical protein